MAPHVRQMLEPIFNPSELELTGAEFDRRTRLTREGVAGALASCVRTIRSGNAWAPRPGVVHFDYMPLPDEILDEAPVLFHDVRPVDIDPEAHAPFVIARVLDQGTMLSVAALLRYYGRDRIRRFFREGGIGRVSRRTVPLWLAFLDLTRDECTPRSSLHRSSPFWTA